MTNQRIPLNHDVAAHAKPGMQRRDKRRLAKEILARHTKVRRWLLYAVASGAAITTVASLAAFYEQARYLAPLGVS